MASKYVISDEELGERIAAMHRETPRRTYAKRVADKYIAPDGGEPPVATDVANVTRLPEAERAEQGDILLAEIEAFLGGFVIYPSEHAKVAHVLWIAHTHLMDVWDSTPRISFLSPEPASGKTRALEISELLVPMPVMAVNVSAAYLFRKVGDTGSKPTVLYDEIDTVFGAKAKENEDIRGLLNAGHRRGAVAGRCVVRGKTIETEEIPAYCAVALAGLGWLPDTILSRSVIIRMRKRKPGERVKPFRPRTCEKQGHILRDRLSRWGAEIRESLKDVWPNMPEGIQDRNADIWEAMLAVADAAGGAWKERARKAATALVKAAREVEPSLGIRLLTDLKEIFGNAREMATEAILPALHSLKESPWNDLRGKPLNDRGLAQRLRQYEIKPKVLGGGARRGYLREDLHDAWERYVPPPSPAASVTSVTEEENPNRFNGEAVTLDVTDCPGAADASVTAAVVTLVANSGVTESGAETAIYDNKINDVTDVTLVTHVVGNRGGKICAQCGAGPATDPPGDAPTVKVIDGDDDAWVHDGPCLRFWKGDHQQ